MFPGLPIDRDEFLACVKALLLGKKLPIPDYPVCDECKMRENTCLFTIGKVCLGPVSRAGCKAICPSYGASCEACRGFISYANIESIQKVMTEHGLSPEEIHSMSTMFNAYQMQQLAQK